MPFLAQLVDDVVVNKIDLEKPSLTLGRHPECDVQIDDATISSRHAELSVARSEYMEDLIEVRLTDLGSTNGTFVNEQQLSEPRLLVNNDIIRVGWNKFKFVDEKHNDLEATAHILQP